MVGAQLCRSRDGGGHRSVFAADEAAVRSNFPEKQKTENASGLKMRPEAFLDCGAAYTAAVSARFRTERRSTSFISSVERVASGKTLLSAYCSMQ